MLWKDYVFKKGDDVHSMWDHQFNKKAGNVLFITGRGFDLRASYILENWLGSVNRSMSALISAELLMINFTEHNLDSDLVNLRETNSKKIEDLFSKIGTITDIQMSAIHDSLNTNQALYKGLVAVLDKIDDSVTDIILDVSSLPRVVYLTLMTGILQKLIPNKFTENPLYANGITFQIIVAEDSKLDSKIKSEDPSNEQIKIPGFVGTMELESSKDWPLVWFPILGENRIGQIQKIIDMDIIPGNAEICPLLPHPSKDPRRAEKLLDEYKNPLFNQLKTPISNILYADEGNPFETYRQLLSAMLDYKESLEIIEGCRLLVTPLASKLITIGSGLACFEMRPDSDDSCYGVGIPYVEQTKYSADLDSLHDFNAEITTLVLTGDPYKKIN